MTKTRIAIADDQVLFRDMLRIILSQDESFEVVGTAGNGQEILEICRETAPDVVLLDVRMPETDGIYALMKLREKNPSIKVIMLTTFEEEELILKACAHAADGYLLKDTKPEALILSVKCVTSGLCVLHPSVRSIIYERMEKPSALFPREDVQMDDFDAVDLSILKNLSMGSNNAEIAQTINYSEGTVKNRISRMLEITSLKDRTQLAIFALQKGLI